MYVDPSRNTKDNPMGIKTWEHSLQAKCSSSYPYGTIRDAIKACNVLSAVLKYLVESNRLSSTTYKQQETDRTENNTEVASNSFSHQQQ